jgi:hypothetical protein
VLPFYQQHGLTIEAVLTENGGSSAAARRIATSSTWRSTTLSIAAPRSASRKPMASSIASTAPP